MRLLDADLLLPGLGFPSLVEALRAGHAAGVDAVDRSLLTRPREGQAPQHLLVWPAWRFGAFAGVKMVTVFPSDDPEHATNHTVYTLFDGRDGTPLATITGAAFTTWKTAADSALGARFLARSDCKVMLMVGAGAQAPALIAAHRAVRPSIERVLVWNRSGPRAARLAETLRGQGVDAQAVDDLEAAVRQADLVSCATGAEVPIVEGGWLKPGCHLDLVGGFTNAMREADDEVARRARFFVDSRRFTIGQCGDITGPVEAGIIAESDIAGDLFDLCQGTAIGRTSEAEITLFKNAGGGHLDLMTAMAVYGAATKA